LNEADSDHWAVTCSPDDGSHQNTAAGFTTVSVMQFSGFMYLNATAVGLPAISDILVDH
jgi:hypothetical protein